MTNTIAIAEKVLATKLREKYVNNLPDGYSKKDILQMSDGDILDMDYFLNDEYVSFDDDWD
jgi:hypothetical protein